MKLASQHIPGSTGYVGTAIGNGSEDFDAFLAMQYQRVASATRQGEVLWWLLSSKSESELEVSKPNLQGAGKACEG
jgi:hypothetical protein